MGWLLTTHHEMGHIEYFLQYKEQAMQFRDGANPGMNDLLDSIRRKQIWQKSRNKKLILGYIGLVQWELANFIQVLSH
jgi:hypothetical protein